MIATEANFFAASPLERLGHLRRDTDWLQAARARGQYLAIWRGKVLLRNGGPPAPSWLTAEVLSEQGEIAKSVLLGERDGMPCFVVGLAGERPPALPGAFEELRGAAGTLSPGDAALLAYGRAMVLWHARHGHCSACGAPTRIIEAGHARQCPECAAKHFPRVDPAIIVLVGDTDRCLLGRQAVWPRGRYSTIAGFVEPGESLEDAVRREVLEETGVRIDEVVYHSSQPWPFPSSLMLGFSATPREDAVTLRDGELEDARWFSREDIATGRVLLPPRESIAYRLIGTWFDRAPGRCLVREVEPASWPLRPEA